MILIYLLIFISPYFQKEQEPSQIFKFDTVIHIQFGVDNDVGELIENQSLHEVVGRPFGVTSENEFWNHLKETEYKAKELGQGDVLQLKEVVFIERKCDNYLIPDCAPIYRDILIFKNDKDTTGIAKVCFSCNQISFSQTDKNIDCFGQFGEYESLREILGQ